MIDRETVNSLEIGLEFNLLIGQNLALYAGWAIRDTNAAYSTYITGIGEDSDYYSELLSAGFNIKVLGTINPQSRQSLFILSVSDLANAEFLNYRQFQVLQIS